MNLKKTRLHKIVLTSFRHGIVSIICGSLEYLSFLFFMQVCKFTWQFSYVPSYVLATIVGYLLHNFYTFRVGGISLKTSLNYITQSALVLVLGFSIVYILVHLNVLPQVSKIVQLFATFFFNIAFGRYITFRKGNL